MLEIDAELTHGDIATEVFFVDTSKRAKEITHRRPHAFSRIGMNFANAIAIIISGPFFVSVTDRGVGPDDMVVSLPFIGVDLGSA
jgi:hypothetical protein